MERTKKFNYDKDSQLVIYTISTIQRPSMGNTRNPPRVNENQIF